MTYVQHAYQTILYYTILYYTTSTLNLLHVTHCLMCAGIALADAVCGRAEGTERAGRSRLTHHRRAERARNSQQLQRDHGGDQCTR